MEIITGEKIQELATAGFSKLDQKEFERKKALSYDIESSYFDNYNNPHPIYLIRHMKDLYLYQ